MDCSDLDDLIREGVAAAVTGTEHLPTGSLVTDVVVIYAFMTPEDHHGWGCTYAGAPHAARGLIELAMDQWCDE